MKLCSSVHFGNQDENYLVLQEKTKFACVVLAQTNTEFYGMGVYSSCSFLLSLRLFG